MKELKKGDLFEYRHMVSKHTYSIYYCMYIDENLYYFIEDNIDELEKVVTSANYFSNLRKGELTFVKNFNVDGMSEEEISNIVIYSKNIIRDNKIDLALS